MIFHREIIVGTLRMRVAISTVDSHTHDRINHVPELAQAVQDTATEAARALNDRLKAWDQSS